MDLLQQGIVVAPNSNISIDAANFSIQHKTPMADSLIYVTALAHGAQLWTQDKHFEGLPRVKYLPKTKP